jgi:hypothetical protein
VQGVSEIGEMLECQSDWLTLDLVDYIAIHEYSIHHHRGIVSTSNNGSKKNS